MKKRQDEWYCIAAEYQRRSAEYFKFAAEYMDNVEILYGERRENMLSEAAFWQSAASAKYKLARHFMGLEGAE